MTQLLVSVRSAGEARLAVAGGADIIDVKEPLRGSLGAAGIEVWKEVAAEVGSTRPLSVALGEYRDFSLLDDGASLRGYSFVKLGLAGAAATADWISRWRGALDRFPRGLRRVAVAYADYGPAECPSPYEVCSAAIAFLCSALLIDTYSKTRGSVFDVIRRDALEAALLQAREAGLTTVLAGSLRRDRLEEALALQPDVIAVRGAVCRGGRVGELDEELVREWAEVCHAAA